FFIVKIEFFAAPPSLVTSPSTGYPFHILPLKNTWANESRCVVPAPWIHGYPTRSMAAADVAVTIAHSTGQGTSTPFCVSAFDASDTATPSFTRAAACARFAGVTRLSVPSSSSLPQRPQLDSSVCQRSYSDFVTRGRDDDCPDGSVCDMRPTPQTTTISEPARASFRITPPES